VHELDLYRLLSEGTVLLSSSGKEFSNVSHLSAQELAQAQREAMGKLGLSFGDNGADDIGMDVGAELAAGAGTDNNGESTSASVPIPSTSTSSSLPPPRFRASASSTPVPPPSKSASPAPAPPVDESEDPYAGLSAREKNKLKRKRKAEGKAGVPPPSTASTPIAKKAKLEPAGKVKKEVKEEEEEDVKVKAEEGEGEGKVIIDPGAKAKERAKLAASGGGEIQVSENGTSTNSLSITPGEWPWHTTVSRLSLGLVSPAWEVRHGSALGLREVLRLQGRCGGMVEGLTKERNQKLHQEWAGDVAARLSCVLALDRFGDYVSDQVSISILLPLYSRWMTKMLALGRCTRSRNRCSSLSRPPSSYVANFLFASSSNPSRHGRATPRFFRWCQVCLASSPFWITRTQVLRGRQARIASRRGGTARSCDEGQDGGRRRQASCSRSAASPQIGRFRFSRWSPRSRR